MKKLLSEEKEAEMMICEKCKTPINVLNGHKFCACINTPTVPPKVEENKNEGEEERCPKCGYMIAKCSDLTIRCGCPVPSSATEKSCEKCGFNHSIKDCPKYNNTASKWTFSDKGGKLLYCEYFTPRQPVNKNEGEELEKIKEVFAKQLSISQLENGMGVYQILPNGKATLNDELLKEILSWHNSKISEVKKKAMALVMAMALKNK